MEHTGVKLRAIGSEMNLKVLGRATGMILFVRTNKMGELEGCPPSEKDFFFVFFLSERKFVTGELLC